MARPASQLVDQGDLTKHFKEMSDLERRVDIEYGDGQVHKRCSLVFSTDETEQLSIVLPIGCSHPTQQLQISYGFKGHAYAFTTRVAGAGQETADGLVIPVGVPSTVEKTERREAFRVVPFDGRPIRMKLDFPSGEFIYTDALDISETGVSFPLPQHLTVLHTEDECRMEIHIPGFEKISTTGTVKNIRHFFGISQMGVHFSQMSEHGHRIIVQYHHVREAEIRLSKEQADNRMGRPRISVVTDLRRAGEYDVLWKEYAVQHIDIVGAFSGLTESNPQLIILDCGPLEVEILLCAMRRHPELRAIPCLVMDVKKEGPTQDDNMVFYAGSADIGATLSLLLSNILQMHELSKTIWHHWQSLAGIGRKILAMDGSLSLSSYHIEYLKSHNYEPIVLYDEEELFREIKNQAPDILLIDEKTGGLDADGFLQLLRMNKMVRNTPIIFFTKDGSRARKYRRNRLITTFLEKPVNQRLLVQEVTYNLVSKIVARANAEPQDHAS